MYVHDVTYTKILVQYYSRDTLEHMHLPRVEPKTRLVSLVDLFREKCSILFSEYLVVLP